MSDENLLFKCTSCRHHMQINPESEEACTSCFNQDNWEPPKADVQSLAEDADMLLAEIDRLTEEFNEVAHENVLLRDENERLRMAYGGVQA